jgi:hypothetical protein
VLQAKTNRFADLRPLVPKVLAAIEFAIPRAIKIIAADRFSTVSQFDGGGMVLSCDMHSLIPP